jgi:putative serine protease PepD
VVAAALLAFGSGAAGVFVGYQLKDDPAPVQQIINAAPSIDESSLAAIAARVMPMVVVITTGSGEGSGVIMTADGVIITNNHVVAGARNDTVTVAFNTGKRVQAKIIGADPQTDIAVIKAEDVSGLKFATFGDSNAVQVGDRVLAIGSPLGLQGSVTSGIVSALHRTISVGGSDGSDRATLGDAIQTDAPINPGNSGGALVNTKGEVIGINSAIVGSGSGQGQAGNIGLGFAISSNRAKSIADQLIAGGKVSHPYLGVQATDAESGGAQLQRVEPGSPAEKAGLKDGDIVTKVGDKVITGSEDLVAAVQAGKVGDTLTMTVTSDGNEKSVSAVLAEKP